MARKEPEKLKIDQLFDERINVIIKLLRRENQGLSLSETLREQLKQEIFKWRFEDRNDAQKSQI